MSGVVHVSRVTEDNEREAVWTHGIQRPTLFNESNVCRVDVRQPLVLGRRGEVIGGEDFLQARLGLQEDEWVVSFRRLEDVEGGNAVIWLTLRELAVDKTPTQD